jgi:phosphate transport system substrate-binding protein
MSATRLVTFGLLMLGIAAGCDKGPKAVGADGKGTTGSATTGTQSASAGSSTTASTAAASTTTSAGKSIGADESSAVSATKSADAEKSGSAGIKPDESIPHYTKVESEVSGTIKSIGSDTMNNLMTRWAEGFKKVYPNVQVEIEGKGSVTAPPALISGTANFGPMSREMKKQEIDAFEAKVGYKPTAIPSAVDVLAVYVHKDNPLAGLSLQQVDAIYSKTRKAGANKDITTWGELGLTGEWADKPISLYGRNAASGTYGFFKEHVLKNGDYKDSVKEQPGSSAVVQGVASDRYAMGYSGIGYKTSDVRAVPLSRSGDKFVSADADNAYNGQYPLSRLLFIYVNYKPDSDLDPLRREFLRFVLSYEGQAVVIDDGFLPLLPKTVNKSLKAINLLGETAAAAKNP